MKQYLKLIVILFIVAGLGYSCGGKYDEVVEVNKDFIQVMDDYITNIEKADNGKDVAKAIDKYVAEWNKIIPRMQEIYKKYPDLKTGKDLPKEIAELNKKSEEMAKRLVGSFQKIMQFASDPEVMAAQQRMATAMQNFPK